MILVDTSLWIDFLRGNDSQVGPWLEGGRVITHEFIIGELACGRMQSRAHFLNLLARLPRLPRCSSDEVLHFLDRNRLYGQGLEIVDLNLLASAKLVGWARIATRDGHLNEAARRLGLTDRD